MKDQSLKSALNRGFTLIELMIVIVILGVLMGTILPRLTGAQGRARDTGRQADLNSISQALETYYSDNGSYPAATTAPSNGAYCLDEATGSPGLMIAGYLKGAKIPRPPTASQTTILFSTTCTGQYLYAPLTKNGLANNGYVLASDMETYQKANAVASTGILATAVSALTTTVSAVSALTNATQTELSTADALATTTVYILVN